MKEYYFNWDERSLIYLFDRFLDRGDSILEAAKNVEQYAAEHNVAVSEQLWQYLFK